MKFPKFLGGAAEETEEAPKPGNTVIVSNLTATRTPKEKVDFHIDRAREKLGVATRVEAVVRAATEGFIKP